MAALLKMSNSASSHQASWLAEAAAVTPVTVSWKQQLQRQLLF